MSERIEVRKTYKLFIGGAFPRSESGRTYEVAAADGTFLANAAKASRKATPVCSRRCIDRLIDAPSIH